MRLGISSWTYPWSIGVPGYPQPAQPLTPLGLLERTRQFGLDVLQIADNCPLEELTGAGLDTLAGQALKWGITLEAGTRGVEPDRLLRYLPGDYKPLTE